MKKNQKILLSIIGVLLVITLFLNAFRINSLTNFLDTTSGYFSLLRYSLIDNPIKSTLNFADSYSELYKVQQENSALRQNIDEIAQMQAMLYELQMENKMLKDINGLKDLSSEYKIINATVIGRAFDTYQNSIIINVGSDDGVKENYAVITPQGLIGKVQSVRNNQSTIRLITTEDGNNKVSVKIRINDFEYADAVLERYDADKQMFLVTLLSANTTITKDMQVTTSGMGGVFPSGILVGSVSEVEELPNALTMRIYVKPSADFSNLNYVSVVERGN